MPRFSVVIPAYNAERTIAETIGSVLAQTEADLELIVIDDESSDSTPELVARLAEVDPRVRLRRQANTGTAGARNAGIAHARAEYISFLDNDDLWMPLYLERMGAALDAEPEAGFAYCNAYALDDESLRIRHRTEFESRLPPRPAASWEEIVAALARANFVMSSATVRRAAVDEVGGFRTDVLGVDDYDLWLRILLSGRTAVAAGREPLLLQRDRADSQSKDNRMMLEGLARVLERALADTRMPDAARAAANEQLETARRERGAATGTARGARVILGARDRAVILRDRLFPGRKFRERAPAEVVAAFPEIGRREADR